MYLLCNDPDPILTAAKKYRCRCEGVCNEYVINGESTISEGYQQRNVSIIKIFFQFQTPFTILNEKICGQYSILLNSLRLLKLW